MSIKGKGQELFVGKQSVTIRDWMYNKKTIQYNDIIKIEYCFRAMTEGGYMDFHDSYGHFERFSFPIKSNEAVQRAADYIAERYPDLEIEKHNLETDPIYSKNVLIGILSVFCTWPIGIILCWCTGKRTVKERIIFTLIVLLVQISIVTFWNLYTRMQMNAAMNTVNDYFDQINSMFQ